MFTNKIIFKHKRGICMKKFTMVFILMIPFISAAEQYKAEPKNTTDINKAKYSKNSESKNIFMYAPSEGEHDFMFRMMIPTGTISSKGFDAKLSGYISNFEYSYGINDKFSLGAKQSLLNDYKITSNTNEIKYSGIGDTSIFAKYFLPIENMELYFSSEYKMGLLEKSKKNYDTNNYNRVAERNSLSLEFGTNFNLEIFSFGGLFLYRSYQSGETEIKSSGLSYTELTDADSGHELSIFSQLNLENFKLGLSFSEGVENEYSSKMSPGSVTTKYLASTNRQLMLYSIIPFADNFEGHFSIMKLEPKDKGDITYNYYVLMAALRVSF